MRICNYCPEILPDTVHANTLYCSNACRTSARMGRKPAILKVCFSPHCKLEYVAKDYRQKFCSSSCSASYHNPRTKRKPREFTDCRVCDKSLIKSQDMFCGHDCRVSFQAFSRYDDWICGYTSASDSNGQLKAWARTILLEVCDYTCACGWNTPNPITGKPILTIDHIDGNWKNNYCWNLRVLCYNCHTLTPTFGALNVGNVSGRRDYGFSRP